jgi:MoaA/NifB/PqqE/SkfB family radical SAM enzyme
MSELLIPKRVTIETIFGCNASCSMCVINQPTKRKKGIMPLSVFYKIIDSLLPYKDQLEMMDLFCLGEPLLDKHIFKRIKYLKDKGFKNIGFSSNAELLDEDKQIQLLESGLDTVIFSIDGIKKETHEKIRRGLNFEKVIENVESIIKKRNKGNYKTRFVIRFIKQDINKNEWEPFKEKWKEIIDKNRNDFITSYDMHTWGGEFDQNEKLARNPEIEKKPCSDISTVLYILADGSVPLCNEDWLHPNFNFGNVKDNQPIEIWNSKRFRKIRELHAKGNKSKLNMCSKCTVNYSIPKKEIVA